MEVNPVVMGNPGQLNHHPLLPWTKALGIFFLVLTYLCGVTQEEILTWDDINKPNTEWEYRRDHRQTHGSPLLPEKVHFPKFYSPSLKLLVQRGDRVLLPCVVQDLGEDHIIWRHRSNIVAGSNISTYSDAEGRIRLFENFTLEISNVNEADEGEYECLLASPTSSALKLTHTVTVQDPPSVAVLPAKGSVVVIEGETVQIGCIPQGNPKPRITWAKKDGPIPAHHQKLFNESVITMEQVSRKHTGLYVCTADNGVGLPAIGAVYVRVLHAPEVEVPKRRIHGGVGFRAQLLCIAYADPIPQIQWFFGQKPVTLNARVEMEYRDKIHHLIINSVRESDFGMYMCTANNTYGYDLRHIEFSGVPNPPVVKRWETISWPPTKKPTILEDSANDLQITARAGQNLQISSDSDDDRSAEMTTTMAPVQTDVQVRLFWAVECYSPLIDYRLAFHLAPAQPLTAQNEVNAPVWTELTIPADHSSTFLHSKSFVLRGLERDRIYESAIKARNKYGWSPISSVFYFSTFPNSTSSESQNWTEIIQQRVDSGDSDSFQHPHVIHSGILGRQNVSWTLKRFHSSSSARVVSTHLAHSFIIVAISAVVSVNTLALILFQMFS